MKFNKTSFTLIELLLGISILSVISLTVYMTFANGIAVNRKAQNLEKSFTDKGQFPSPWEQFHYQVKAEPKGSDNPIQTVKVGIGWGSSQTEKELKTSTYLLTAADSKN